MFRDGALIPSRCVYQQEMKRYFYEKRLVIHCEIKGQTIRLRYRSESVYTYESEYMYNGRYREAACLARAYENLYLYIIMSTKAFVRTFFRRSTRVQRFKLYSDPLPVLLFRISLL